MKKLLIIITICLLLFGAYMVERSMLHDDEERYNNGICTECSGHLNQVSTWIDKADGTTVYTFKCDTCGNRISLHHFGKD